MKIQTISIITKLSIGKRCSKYWKLVNITYLTVMLYMAIILGNGACEHWWRECKLMWAFYSATVLNEIKDAYKLQRTITQLSKGIHSRLFVTALFGQAVYGRQPKSSWPGDWMSQIWKMHIAEYCEAARSKWLDTHILIFKTYCYILIVEYELAVK